MKKEGIALILLSFLLCFPLVFAQEPIQEYSGLNRFVDNFKLFFSSGDNKVNLALEIREKEIDSALTKLEGEEADKNLDRAREKLLIVQEKVSTKNAEKVRNNVNELKNKVDEYGNLSEEFEIYLLEEEKTQLAAKLVVEVDGKDGQTLKREVVKDGSTGQNIVKIVVVGENGEEIITETQGQIGQIQNQIAERVVKIDMAGKINKAELENGVYVAEGDGNGNNRLSPEIKTDIQEGTMKKDFIEGEPEDFAPGTSDGGNTETPNVAVNSEEIENTGDCGDGVDCGDGSAEPGIEEVQDEPALAVDSNEGDSDTTITGNVIVENKNPLILIKVLKYFFRVDF